MLVKARFVKYLIEGNICFGYFTRTIILRRCDISALASVHGQNRN